MTAISIHYMPRMLYFCISERYPNTLMTEGKLTNVPHPSNCYAVNKEEDMIGKDNCNSFSEVTMKCSLAKKGGG